MKRTKLVAFLAAFLLPLLPQAQDLADYSMVVSEEEFQSIARPQTILQNVNGDGNSDTVALPFSFPFGSTTFAQGVTFTVRPDAYLYFGSTSASHNANSAWTSTSTVYTLIGGPMIGDGKITASTSALTGVYHLDTIDNNGDSLLILEFRSMMCYYSPNGNYNFQLRLHTNGDVSLVFDSCVASSYSAVRQNFILINGTSEKIGLGGTWASPTTVTFAGSPTLPDLGQNLPASGTVFTWKRPESFCPRISNLAIVPSLDGGSASWTGSDDAGAYLVRCGSFEQTTTDENIVISGLAHSSSFTLEVYTLCSSGDTSRPMALSFQTLCSNITVDDSAYEVDFEQWQAVQSAFNQCWHRLYYDYESGNFNSTTTWGLPIISTAEAHSGTKSLRMYTELYYDDEEDYDNRSFAFMPPIGQDLHSLNCTFWYKVPSGYQNTRLAVGLSSSTSDSSTFRRMMTIIPTDNNWHQYTLDLPNYNGPGNIITFYFYNDGNNENTYYSYIDDIRLEDLGDCFRPLSISLSELQSESVVVSWREFNTVGDYKVVLNGDEENAYLVNGDTSVLVSLVPNTQYTIAVSRLCDGQYTAPRTYTFRSPCSAVAHEDLPWTENFDSATPTGANATTPVQVPCLTINHWRGSSYYYPYANTSTRYGNSGNSLYFYQYGQSTPQLVALPLFEDEISSLQISFYTYFSNTNNKFLLGTMTNPTDVSTFVPLDTISPTATSTWEYQEYRFSGYEGEGNFIAIRPMQNVYSNLYLDNLTVGIASDCARPASVSIDSISSRSVSISINDPEEQDSYLVEIFRSGDTIREQISTNTYTCDSLQPAANYTINVYTVCADVTTAPITVNFSTPCDVVDMPWSEDFNSITNINQLNCWELKKGLYDDATGTATLTTVNERWMASTYGGDGSRNLRVNIYGTDVRHWMITPAINITDASAVLSLEISLNRYNQNTSGDTGNGVQDDRFMILATTNGGSSWTPIATWGSQPTDTYAYTEVPATATPVSVSLANFAGQAIRLGFYGESSVSGVDNDFHIDNIIIESQNCTLPAALSATEIEAHSATLYWRGEGNFEYRYALTADTSSWTTGTTTDTSVSLTALSSSTNYTFQVRTNCGSDGTSRWATISFRTACTTLTAADLPYIEDFNSYNTGANADIDPCWYRQSYYPSQPSFPYPSTSQRRNSTGNSLSFYPGYSYQPQFAVLPPVDTVSNTYINFFLYRPNSNVRMEIGVMEDPTDTTTFSLISICEPATSAWQEYTIPFSSYNGNGHYIAFRARVTTSYGYYIYLDDVSLRIANFCTDSIFGLQTTNLGSTEVSLAWQTSIGISDSVSIDLSAAGEPNLHFSASDTNGATLSGLTPETSYTATLSVYCHGNITASASLSFTTLCNNATLVELSSTTLNRPTSTSTTQRNIPIHGWFRYTASQQVYTAADLANTPMDISSLAFNYIGTNDFNTYTDCRIYLSHTADSVLSSTWIPTDTMTLVYSGPMTFSANSGWTSFNFTSSFHYNGTDNLLITIIGNGTATSTNVDRFSAHTTVANTSHRYLDDNTSFDANTSPSVSPLSARADVRFLACGIAPTDSVFYTVSAVSANEAMGSASCSPSGSQLAGTVITATATPLSGFAFTGWTLGGNIVSTDNPYTFTLSANTALTATFAAEVGIDAANGTDVMLYPNPASSVVNIDNPAGHFSLTLLDASGRRVLSLQADGKASIDVSQLAKGTYFLHIADSKNSTVKKLVVE